MFGSPVASLAFAFLVLTSCEASTTCNSLSQPMPSQVELTSLSAEFDCNSIEIWTGPVETALSHLVTPEWISPCILTDSGFRGYVVSIRSQDRLDCLVYLAYPPLGSCGPATCHFRNRIDVTNCSSTVDTDCEDY